MQARKIAVAAIAVVLGTASSSPVAGGGGNLRVGITIVPSCDIHRPERLPDDSLRAVRVSCAAHVPYRISHTGKPPHMANPAQIAAATAISPGTANVVVTTVTF